MDTTDAAHRRATDIYQILAGELGVTRAEAKRITLGACYARSPQDVCADVLHGQICQLENQLATVHQRYQDRLQYVRDLQLAVSDHTARLAKIKELVGV